MPPRAFAAWTLLISVRVFDCQHLRWVRQSDPGADPDQERNRLSRWPYQNNCQHFQQRCQYLDLGKIDTFGQTTSWLRNSQGQLIHLVDAAGSSAATHVSYAYDAFGNLTRTTDAAGNATTLGYDLRGRRVTLHDPDLAAWSYD